jgi:hypothetical protein
MEDLRTHRVTDTCSGWHRRHSNGLLADLVAAAKLRTYQSQASDHIHKELRPFLTVKEAAQGSQHRTPLRAAERHRSGRRVHRDRTQHPEPDSFENPSRLHRTTGGSAA